MGEYYSINPETCTMEELRNAIAECESKEEYYHTMEQSCKKFINSMYGAIGSNLYNCSNVDIAESITKQGQHLIKFSVKAIDSYFKNHWKNDTEGHKRVGNAMRELYPDFDYDRFVNDAARLTVVAPTVNGEETLQVYGDSVDGNSVVMVSDGNNCFNMTIEDLFSYCMYKHGCCVGNDGHMRCDCDYLVGNYKNGNFVYSNVRKIISHKVTKDKYVLKCMFDGIEYSVFVTSDHSMIVFDSNGNEIVKKPYEVTNDDVICLYDGNVPILCKIGSCEKMNCGFDNEFVYDIEMDDETHTFYANNILVHNTDSVSSDSIIYTTKHKDGISISEFYEENSSNIGDSTLSGHESVNTDDEVLNWNKSEGAYFGKVKRIIRHKVSKPKWRLKTKSGKVIECTDNHSLVVFRDGEELHIKPCEIKHGDKILKIC